MPATARTRRARDAMQALGMPKTQPAMHRNRLRASLAAILLAVLAGCAPTTRSTVPAGDASFAGRIATRDANSVLLVATSVQPAGSDQASVRVREDTRLLHASGAPATMADLQVGRHVRAWFDGPVMESYPVQATAGAIVIDPQ